MIHRLVPPFILEQYSARKFSGCFQAVGLFVDISGFSSMTDTLMAHGQHGAEVLAEIMRSVLDPLIESVYEQGGFVASSAGDAFTALFSMEAGREDAALRALAAAVHIQQRRQERQFFDTPYQTFGISVKVGLAAGEVRWGIVPFGESRRGVFYFQGPAIDGCAEAEHQARAGQIILDTALLERIRDWVETEPAGAYASIQKVTIPLPDKQAVALGQPDLSLMSQFYPLNVLTRGPSGEFRQVVNMFISLPSVRTEVQLLRFMESLFELQEKYGGLINRLDFGDKGTNLLLFWGAPAAFENDIERALNFILDLQVITSIPISAGLTYRISHAGFIGSLLHEEYTCFGRGVSLAARFMTSAPRGEIWVDEEIARRAANHFEIEFVKESRFKGFQQPQKVYALLERKEQALAFFTSQFAGRKSDLAQLTRFAEPIFQNEYAGLMVVTGEPGIGKSRLVYEFMGHLEQNRPGAAQVILGQTDDILCLSLNPFEYALRRYFGISAVQGEARNKRAFNRKLDELIADSSNTALAEELDRTRSCLGAMLDLHWPDSLYEQLDAQGRYKNTFISLITLFKLESCRLPLIIVLEDIHQLDDDSRAFMAYLLRLLSTPESDAAGEHSDHSKHARYRVPGNYPIAIIATSREVEPFSDEDSCQAGCFELHLEGLDRQSLQMLAQEQFNGPLGNHLLSFLEQHAEGNPFYAEQILHYLNDEALLMQSATGWEIDQAQVSALPTDVNVLLVARLDRLTQEVKEVVQTASILGREFEIDLLNCMLSRRDATTPPEEVSIAEREAIWAPLNEIRYIFKHVLMRDAAYQMQVRTRRQTLHRLALAAYEKLYADRLADRYGELAYHAEQAGLPEKAIHYLHIAGCAAFEAFQNHLAVDYFTRALALIADVDVEKRYELLLAREDVYARLGSQTPRQQDLADLDSLLPKLKDAGKTVEVLLRQARCAADISQYGEVDRLAGEARTLAATSGQIDRVADAFHLLSLSSLRQGNAAEAFSLAQHCLDINREAQSENGEIRALMILGLAATSLGQMDTAHQYLTRCKDLAEQTGNLYSLVGSLNNLGQIYSIQGDYIAARACLERSRAIAQKMGDRTSEVITTGNLGFQAMALGEYDQARALIEHYLHIAIDAGIPYVQANALINLSACCGLQGEHENAALFAQRALDLSRKIKDRSGEGWALTYLGDGLLAGGDLEAAMAIYTQAVMIRQELNQPELAAEPYAGLARAALLRGDLVSAQEYIAPILDHLDQGKSLEGADQPLRVYLTCYRVLQQSDNPRQQALLAAGHRLLQERAAKIKDEAIRMAFLTNVSDHREIQAAWAAAQAEDGSANTNHRVAD